VKLKLGCKKWEVGTSEKREGHKKREGERERKGGRGRGGLG